jgi:hypothetical protein
MHKLNKKIQINPSLQSTKGHSIYLHLKFIA